MSLGGCRPNGVCRRRTRDHAFLSSFCRKQKGWFSQSIEKSRDVTSACRKQKALWRCVRVWGARFSGSGIPHAKRPTGERRKRNFGLFSMKLPNEAKNVGRIISSRIKLQKLLQRPSYLSSVFLEQLLKQACLLQLISHTSVSVYVHRVQGNSHTSVPVYVHRVQGKSPSSV